MWPARRWSWTLGASAALLLALPVPSQAQSQEERRRALQERLGIKPQPPKPQPDVPDAGQAAEAVQAPDPAPAEGAAEPAPTRRVTQPRGPTFGAQVLPVLNKECESCHKADGKAKKSKWVLRGTPEDYELTLRFVDRANPAKSRLLTKGTGTTLHGGKKTIAVDSPEYVTLLKWIEAGAPRGTLGEGSAPAPEAPAAVSGSTPDRAPVAGTPPAAAAPQAPAPGAAPQEGAAPSLAETPPAEAPASTPAGGPRFAPRLHALLQEGCGSCHAPGEMAGGTRYLVSADPAQHLQAVLPLVVPRSPATSLLYQRALGEQHEAGAIWEPGSAELAALAEWIEAGAQGEPQPVAGAPAASPTGAAAPAAPPAPSPAPGPAVAGHPQPGGIPLGTFPLLGSLQLNGRFDLNYERTGYNDHPFQDGLNALRSHHQFLFLSRRSTSDPVTLTLELLSLQFWELGYRFDDHSWPVKVSLKLGKLLVPFGGDPLFHHSYGGHAGFDQKVLPVVFAREGAAVNLQRRLGSFALSADLYVLAGYRLRQADSVLNLQSDFAPPEETRLGFGARLGGSWGPLSLWYSPYFNTLGFGRRLFLQALDLSVWRPRGIPVLERFSLGAGLLRGDVSGGAEEGYGGPNDDYFHFASYLQLRYYPTDWLYVQYRQGLRTFNNRQGLFLDPTDLTAQDGSTHNLGVVARWRGLSAGLYHYWNLEKANETADDFTRLVVVYEF